MEDRLIRVAITQGDTNGVGYEQIFKTFSSPEMLELCTPIIYGSPKVATYHRKALNMQVNMTIIDKAEDAQDGCINLLTCFDDEVKVELGHHTPESGNAAMRALDRAMTDFRNSLFDVLVTNHIVRGSENVSFHFRTMSHFIETCAGEGKKVLNMLLGEGIRVALMTDDIPHKEVSETITKENIMERATQFHLALQRDLRLTNPRIAILALNPSANGEEEENAIRPAIEQLAENSIQAFGPYPADSFFGEGQHRLFDGVLAMYHTQGSLPFKTLEPTGGISFYGGTSLVCTSPTETEIFRNAGKGLTDELPLRHAIFQAIDIYRNRTSYDIAHEHPLEKLYHEKRDESEKVRFAIPKKKTENNNK